ncbi:MAG: RNA-directed DNA polymerase [Candidatus Electrothrix sp. GW3-4]|uniref:RNA-directed DNA polymerase n=1 Tax=Candidatus Electrothrix sp. GW3-4 TaxID=3126740 RepID=UPI0030CEF756
MKRLNNLYPQITDPDNLRLAFCKAARGKQDRAEAVRFRADFERNIQKLHRQLLLEEPDIGHYRFFTVCDPKPRRICAASFPERVLHHAIMNVCEPALNAYHIYDTYACLPGRGQYKALDRAVKFSGSSSWYLQLDIRHYFDSIDHRIMLDLLKRRFKDKQLLNLFAQLLDSFHSRPGKGLPIGNLISQHLANYYLGIFDHWIKEERRYKKYLRYMDDFVLFGQSKEKLRQELCRIEEYLERTLQLQLRQPIKLNRCRLGVTFLGYRVFPSGLRLSAQSKKRFIRKLKQYEEMYQLGIWGEDTLSRHVEPLIEFTRHAKADGFRRTVLERYGGCPEAPTA